MSRIVRIAAAGLLAIAAGSCNDVNKQESPVTLVVSTSQTLHHIDVAPGASGCNTSLGTVTMQAILVQAPNANTPNPPNGFPAPGTSPADLNQVKVTSYQVSWNRLDGGHLIPAPVVRSTSILLAPGQSSNLSTLVVFTPDMLNLAPFAALQPQNGGVDPETGKATISLDAVITVFGETLAGSRVSGNTHMTLDFCYSCNGCF